MSNRLLDPLTLHGWLNRILSQPYPVISVIGVITLFFSFQVFRLSFNTSVYDLVIENIPETVQYQDYKAVFGSDEIIRIVVRGDNIFSPGSFAMIQQLSDEVSRIKGVKRIISLPDVKKTVDIGNKWAIDQFAERLMPISMFQKNLISMDHKTTAITVILSDDANRKLVIQDIEALVSRIPKPASGYQIGIPLVSEALASLTRQDFLSLPPICMILFATMLWLIYRNINCVLLPIVCVTTALIWTFGLMALCGIAMSMLTMMVPVFLMAIGIAYCLHICSEYMHHCQSGDSPRQVVFQTFSQTAFPTSLTILTTVIGFASLLINKINVIREFAIFSCIGMVSLLIILYTLFPASLSILSTPKKTKPVFTDYLFDRLIQQIIDINRRHQRIVFPIAAGISIFCIIGIFRIQAETNPMEYLKKSDPVSQHFHDIYRDLSGSFPLNVVVRTTVSDFYENPAHVAHLSTIQQFLETLPGVDKTLSFADYLKLVNYASNRFEPQFYALPEESFEVRMLINTYRMMLGSDMLKPFMDSEFSTASILLFTHISSANGFMETRDRILEFEKQYVLSEGVQLEVTGLGMAIAASSHLVTRGQIKSLSLTMIIIFGLMFMLFLSWKVGTIAIVPNLFPVIINFGMMGWLNIELSMVTSLIASIAIGLSVDDTVHYLVWYNREFQKDLNRGRAMNDTLLRVGSPMIFTTITICIGFSILMLSSFKPTVTLGGMMVVIMISAMAGDILLLPGLMMHVELVTLWDLVRLKLGKDPHRGIPLFKGLSRAQVHSILLASNLKPLSNNQVLFEKGDISDSMYAIISGKLDVIDRVLVETPDTCYYLRKHVARLDIGDVVGEMGLFRQSPRSATVVAAADTELLNISWKMISRLQWLYPTISHRFLLNLMHTMCDRLERSTHCLSNTSFQDDLTGMGNRKEFERILDIEISRAKLYGEELCICFIGFSIDPSELSQNLNDWYRFLQSAGQGILHSMRPIDTVCRFDEHVFSIIMPHTDLSSAKTICKRVENIVNDTGRQLSFPSFRTDVAVSALSGTDCTTRTDLILHALKQIQNSQETGLS
ncbi:MAG: MMPL family transporter [Desulfatirhabdiaceae bacterium]